MDHTVNIANASYTNDIGAVQLSVLWKDPDFDSDHEALYLMRVLEIPTPRWTTVDAKTLGIPIPKGVPEIIQERAWSSQFGSMLIDEIS